MQTLPTFSIDLIEQLDEHYPEKAPELRDTDREVWFKAGQRSVVRQLLQLKKDIEEENSMGEES